MLLLRSPAGAGAGAGALSASRRCSSSSRHPIINPAPPPLPQTAPPAGPVPMRWQAREHVRMRALDRLEAFGGPAAATRRRKAARRQLQEGGVAVRASSSSSGGSSSSSSSSSSGGPGTSSALPAIGAGAAAAGATFGGGGNGDEAADPLATVELIEKAAEKTRLNWLDRFRPPKWLLRAVACAVLGGQVCARLARGRVHWRNTRDQLRLVGPRSLGVALLTAGFVGMVFTIQFVREFAKLGLTRSVGGVLALALARELTPVVTAIILAGRVGSAFAAELGTMQVSEQVDSLRVLFTDPVDYLVTPRVVACMVAGPILNVLCLCMGLGAAVLLADLVYSVPANVILDSARRALTTYDVGVSCVKAWVFGLCISTISCAWGFTTTGGAKGVGEATTSAVVISLVTIFVADFFLSFLFFQGSGDALKQLK